MSRAWVIAFTRILIPVALRAPRLSFGPAE
jgi:hypothetical protein